MIPCCSWFKLIIVYKLSVRSVAAATILPKFLKFWAPPHDFALVLIVGSFEFWSCLIEDDFESLTLTQDSILIALGIYGESQTLSWFLLIDRAICSLLRVTVVGG